MKTLYSIVNPVKWKCEQRYNTIQNYSSSDTFQSVMYAHYTNIGKLIDRIGFFDTLSNDYTVCCLSYAHYENFIQMQNFNYRNCQINTVYYFDNGHYFPNADWLDKKRHNPPLWNIVLGDLYTMKKFTQVYKSQEGGKVYNKFNDPSLNLWESDSTLSQKVLMPHVWSRTGMNLRLIDE